MSGRASRRRRRRKHPRHRRDRAECPSIAVEGLPPNPCARGRIPRVGRCARRAGARTPAATEIRVVPGRPGPRLGRALGPFPSPISVAGLVRPSCHLSFITSIFSASSQIRSDPRHAMGAWRRSTAPGRGPRSLRGIGSSLGLEVERIGPRVRASTHGRLDADPPRGGTVATPSAPQPRYGSPRVMKPTIEVRAAGRIAVPEGPTTLGDPAVTFLQALAAWQVARALRRDRPAGVVDAPAPGSSGGPGRRLRRCGTNDSGHRRTSRTRFRTSDNSVEIPSRATKARSPARSRLNLVEIKGFQRKYSRDDGFECARPGLSRSRRPSQNRASMQKRGER